MPFPASVVHGAHGVRETARVSAALSRGGDTRPLGSSASDGGDTSWGG
jgi:hypothetical protein